MIKDNLGHSDIRTTQIYLQAVPRIKSKEIKKIFDRWKQRKDRRKVVMIEVPEYLKKLLEIEEKVKLKRYCNDIIVTQEDFVKLITNCYKIGYLHQIKHHDFVSSHLHPSEKEKDALASVTVGERITGDAKKFMNKISQIFKERRYLVAHIFFNEKKWHMFYFDQRDAESQRKNHWKKGAHIHFVNYLWPQYDLNKLWEIFDMANASAGGKLHIKFEGQDYDRINSTI
ncbi:MAG: hypothetical protein P9L93_04935 [Candidatus Gorgyraea atricola]|nr:hypothetical protein [Candidatus Gorgyraea atricola]